MTVGKYLAVALVAALSSVNVCAAVLAPLPASLAYEALSETMPTAFAPAEYSTEDFSVEWVGTQPPGVDARLEARSIEWVRVQDVLVVPRARLLVTVDRSGSGAVSQSGFSQPLVADGTGRLEAALPVALLSGPANEIRVVFDGVEAKLRVRFAPRKGMPRGLVGVDPSCSRYGLEPTISDDEKSSQADWIYIGCRLLGVESADHRTSSLEVFVLWEGAGDTVRLGGTPIAQASASVWLLRLKSKPGDLLLKGGTRELALKYSIPEYLHRGSLAAGYGPYSYQFQSTTENTRTVVPILTLYGSMQLYDAIRLVAFDATTFSHELQSDIGLYINLEQFRTFDRRVGLNLMLGAHLIGLRTGNGDFLVLFGAPQGIELVVSDFLGKNRNLAMGAFIYPSIAGKAYYNSWLRWGSPSLFGEVNYISWEDTTPIRGRFYSRSLGVSVGIPLARFL